MIYEDYGGKIFSYFTATRLFDVSWWSHDYTHMINEWVKFISYLDMGIEFVQFNRYKKYNVYDAYEIIDEKKWLLAKLKYGI
jgi:hypothetical protein